MMAFLSFDCIITTGFGEVTSLVLLWFSFDGRFLTVTVVLLPSDFGDILFSRGTTHHGQYTG
jgi:hypothetical protein